jgi:pentatricopeptide repeat protein
MTMIMIRRQCSLASRLSRSNNDRYRPSHRSPLNRSSSCDCNVGAVAPISRTSSSSSSPLIQPRMEQHRKLFSSSRLLFDKNCSIRSRQMRQNCEHSRNAHWDFSEYKQKYHGCGWIKEKLINTPCSENCTGQKRQSKQYHPNQHRNSPRFYSTRLVSESAARQTTQLFLEAYRNSPISSVNADVDIHEHENNRDSSTPSLPPWSDSASLLAAEQALEFWANRNNNSNNHKKKNQNMNNNHHRPSQSATQQHEEDAAIAHRLFAALEHINSCLDERSNDAILSNGMLSHVIDALAKSPRMEHIQLADTYLRKFMELYLLHHNMQHSLASQPSSMQKLLEQIRKAPHHSLFTRNVIRWINTDKHHFPNQIRITGVMRGYTRQSKPQAAEALLHLMRDLSSYHTSNRLQSYMQIFRPNAVGYATVIDAYSRVQDGTNAERILRLMGGAINVVAYNATISAWARRAKGLHDYTGTPLSPKSFPNGAAITSSRQAAENAERLLREMWNYGFGDNVSDNGEESRNTSLTNNCSTLLPDVVTYSTVISAYATCLDQPFGSERAHELLTELEGLATQEFEDTLSAMRYGEQNSTTLLYGRGRNLHGFQPNTSVYNTILQAYANAGDSISAEAILESMISSHSSSLKDGGGGPFQHVRPNTRTFNVVLNAIAKGNGSDAGQRAKKILKRLEELMESRDDDGLQPDIISYNSVLAAWSKSASVDHDTSNIENDSEKFMVGKYAAYEALHLLDHIEERYMNSVQSVKPDVISYNTTISAFANASRHCNNGTTMAEKAEDLLTRMVKLGIQPDSYSYNGVLLAWSRSSGGLKAAKHAESILRSMTVSPTIVSWSTVVNAYAHADGAQRAEALLRETEEVFASSSSLPSQDNQGNGKSPIIPSIVLYNNVLHSWGRSSEANASRNAEVLFNRMQNLSHLPSPDAISYRLVLSALEHTLDEDKAERARSILNRLLASNEAKTLQINLHEILNAFNSVLAACAYTPYEAGEYHRCNAARILVETLRDANQFPWPAGGRNNTSGNVTTTCGPNQETYAHFIQGCIHLFDPSSKERNALLKLSIRECFYRGLLSRSIWDKVCAAIGTQAAKEFLGNGFPEEWFDTGLK